MTTPTIHPAVPSTGLGSTSFTVHLIAVLTGIATMVTSMTGALPLNMRPWAVVAGAALATVSTAFKLMHDQGIHLATIRAVGSSITSNLVVPTEQLAQAIDFSASPEYKAMRADLDTVHGQLESIPGADAITSIVHAALATAFATPPAGTQPQPVPEA